MVADREQADADADGGELRTEQQLRPHRPAQQRLGPALLLLAPQQPGHREQRPQGSHDVDGRAIAPRREPTRRVELEALPVQRIEGAAGGRA